MFAGMINGVGGLLDDSPADDATITLLSLAASVKTALDRFFTTAQNNLQALNSKIYGGSGQFDIKALLDVSGLGYLFEADPGEVFSFWNAFDFLTDDGVTAVTFEKSIQGLDQYMAILVLKTVGYYVFIDTGRDQNACSSLPAGVWNNNVSESSHSSAWKILY